jgi:hypothetical protein
MPDQSPPLPLHQRSLPTTPHATICHPSSQRHCRPRLGQQGLGRSGTGGWESAATGLQVLVATGAMGWDPQARTGDSGQGAGEAGAAAAAPKLAWKRGYKPGEPDGPTMIPGGDGGGRVGGVPEQTHANNRTTTTREAALTKNAWRKRTANAIHCSIHQTLKGAERTPVRGACGRTSVAWRWIQGTCNHNY